MEQYYILLVSALVILAIIDLVVGVSNDAVNFLNSAIGSKVLSFRNILIIASLGVLAGALTSNGMMEVARKGIFSPQYFYFNEIMIIFLAVMITDILLLDLFNSIGMPTSTTVSIVFELLGAAVAMSLIKISHTQGESLADLVKYINTGKAMLIIFGILLSVVVAFTVGALVQFITRLFFSFKLDKKKSYVKVLFGGIALTSITYFIIIKGLKGTPFYSDIKPYINDNIAYIIGGGFVFWTLISQLLISVFKYDIFKFIIGIGTFSLALAFAGNDLVNFIGVPMAALNSYQYWVSSGVPSHELSMEFLSGKVPANTLYLLSAGLIMVITIWMSNKARDVIKTSIDISRQDDSKERFQSNAFSRAIVRAAIQMNNGISRIVPESVLKKIDRQFQRPKIKLSKNKIHELPAFDAVRASVNLFIAGILISIGTSYKLPLSTTYVTFMVAMGTSLADRAWGRESAVYRVAGVFNVIGGWFLTALSAFIISALFAYLMYLGGMVSISVLLTLLAFTLIRSTAKNKKKRLEEKEKSMKKNAEILTINEVINESASHISEVAKRIHKLYNNVVNDLATHELNKLNKTDKQVNILNEELQELQNDVFDFIQSLDENSTKAGRFYILLLGYLQDIAQSIKYISKSSYKHVNNNHKQLKPSQISDLKNINKDLKGLLKKIENDFDSGNFAEIDSILKRQEDLSTKLSELLDKQINRIRMEETSKRNTALYFGILLETKEITEKLHKVLSLYKKNHILYKHIR